MRELDSDEFGTSYLVTAEEDEIIGTFLALMGEEGRISVPVTFLRKLANALTDRSVRYDPKHGDNAKCAESGCDHTYERHFDTYDNMRAIGCKYCPCRTFVEPPCPVPSPPTKSAKK